MTIRRHLFIKEVSVTKAAQSRRCSNIHLLLLLFNDRFPLKSKYSVRIKPLLKWHVYLYRMGRRDPLAQKFDFEIN